VALDVAAVERSERPVAGAELKLKRHLSADHDVEMTVAIDIQEFHVFRKLVIDCRRRFDAREQTTMAVVDVEIHLPLLWSPASAGEQVGKPSSLTSPTAMASPLPAYASR
jgi:hypothetical protein